MKHLILFEKFLGIGKDTEEDLVVKMRKAHQNLRDMDSEIRMGFIDKTDRPFTRFVKQTNKILDNLIKMSKLSGIAYNNYTEEYFEYVYNQLENHIEQMPELSGTGGEDLKKIYRKVNELAPLYGYEPRKFKWRQ